MERASQIDGCGGCDLTDFHLAESDDGLDDQITCVTKMEHFAHVSKVAL